MFPRKKNTARFCCAFLCFLMLFSTLPQYAAARSENATLKVGDTTTFTHYAYYSWVNSYSWRIDSGSDVIRITSGENSRDCAIKAIGAGQAKLVGTASGKNYNYSHTVTIAVEENYDGQLTSINGVTPSDLDVNTAYVYVDGTPALFYVARTSTTAGGYKTFSLYSVENNVLNQYIHFIIRPTVKVNQVVDTTSKLTKSDSLTIYYHDSFGDAAEKTYYSPGSSGGNNKMMLTAKSGEHYEGCFTGDVKQLQKYGTRSHTVEGVFNLTWGEFDAEIAKMYDNGGTLPVSRTQQTQQSQPQQQTTVASSSGGGSGLKGGTSVTVTIPSFAVRLNGQLIDSMYEQYPLITFRDITYFPTTYYGARWMGLTTEYSQASGLSVSLGTRDKSYTGYPQSNKNASSQQASVASGPIKVNGKSIDNSAETYPLLLFRGVTYFPMTWRFMHDEFGFDYQFSNSTGLTLNSGSGSNSSNSSNDSNSSSGSNSSSSGSSSKAYDPYDDECPTCYGLGECPKCYGEGGSDCTCLMGQCTHCAGEGTIKSYSYGEIRERTCTYCRGSGDCQKCGGDGWIECSRCKGTGDCPTCHGSGHK